MASCLVSKCSLVIGVWRWLEDRSGTSANALLVKVRVRMNKNLRGDQSKEALHPPTIQVRTWSPTLIGYTTSRPCLSTNTENVFAATESHEDGRVRHCAGLWLSRAISSLCLLLKQQQKGQF